MAVAPRPLADFLPLPRHRALLTALLGPASIARPAAIQWLDAIDFDLIDVAEQRLMPFLDCRLREFGIEHSTTGRVRGLYRRAWYVDQIMRSQLDGILEIIAGASSQAVLLKGVVLGRLVYDHPAHRPYDDFDILVPFGMQAKAVAALKQAGGTVIPPSFHAMTVIMPGGRSVDVHRSPYQLAFQAVHVAPLFTRLRRIELDDPAAGGTAHRSSGPWFTLGNADQLLHTLMHGLVPSPLPPIRWIVDAAMLMRRERDHIDWDLFRHEAIRLEFVEPAVVGLGEVLGYEPNDDARRTLALLERRTSPPAVEQWCQRRRQSGIIVQWDKTRRNARGLGRVALILRLLLAQYGLTGLARKVIVKGIPHTLALVKNLCERRRQIRHQRE